MRSYAERYCAYAEQRLEAWDDPRQSEPDGDDSPWQPWAPFPDSPQQDARDCPADEIFYGGEAGGGKMLAMDTPLPTPTGWTTIGDVRVGDSLLDERGGSCRILAVHPVDLAPVSYRLTFDDDSQIDACADHLWLTFDARELAGLTRLDPEWRARRRASRPSRVAGKKSAKFTTAIVARNRLAPPPCKPAPTGAVRTTREIAETLVTWRGRRNHAVPVAAPVELAEAHLPLDPYLLGVWLGDGNTSAGSITTTDPEIIKAFTDGGFQVGAVHGITHRILRLQVILRTMGVLGDKHVPSAYLRASRAQRLALLQGLMDTDGTVCESGSVEFTNTNYQLVSAVHELAMTLGWKGRIVEGRATLYGRDCGPKWDVKWTPSEVVFRLPRKRDRQKLAQRRTTRFRYVVACDPIPSKPMRCITVDNPTGLFLCGRSMIPTHNSNLIVGLALTQHWRSLILRREATQLSEIRAQLLDFAPPGSHWRSVGNGGVMRTPDGREIELAGLPNEDDKRKYQGRPHDLKAFDEVTEFTESQVDYVCGWNRTTKPGQRCRKVFTGNPPLHTGGEWVIRRFGRWLNPLNGPTVPSGHKLWFVRRTVNGKDTEQEVPDDSPVEIDGRMIRPQSRTFIRAGLRDNPILSATDYASRIEAMPAAIKAVLKGDFNIALQDDPWQVIPTAWVLAAMRRWTDGVPEGVPLSAAGLDVAYGGSDRTVYFPRHGDWIGKARVWPGKETDSGERAAELVSPLLMTSKAPVYVDGIGWGAACFEALKRKGYKAEAVLFGNGCLRWTDKRRVLAFTNLRAYAYWHLRDLLDPDLGATLALPPDDDNELLSELTAARYEMVGGRVKVEAKADIVERLGRSPDKADAVVLACYEPVRSTHHLEAVTVVRRPRGQDEWQEFDPLRR